MQTNMQNRILSLAKSREGGITLEETINRSNRRGLRIIPNPLAEELCNDPGVPEKVQTRVVRASPFRTGTLIAHTYPGVEFGEVAVRDVGERWLKCVDPSTHFTLLFPVPTHFLISKDVGLVINHEIFGGKPLIQLIDVGDSIRKIEILYRKYIMAVDILPRSDLGTVERVLFGIPNLTTKADQKAITVRYFSRAGTELIRSMQHTYIGSLVRSTINKGTVFAHNLPSDLLDSLVVKSE